MTEKNRKRKALPSFESTTNVSIIRTTRSIQQKQHYFKKYREEAKQEIPWDVNRMTINGSEQLD